MRFAEAALAVALLAVGTGCGKGGGGAASGPACTTATQGQSSSLLTTSATNVIPLYVADSATTGNNFYPNEPLVSVTICSPNHTLASQCTTVSNILLDTGSFGLRVFGSALGSNVALTQQTVAINGSTYNLAECATFGSGADWGSVQTGDLIIGNQSATAIPIHVIDIGFAKIPSSCSSLSPDTDPCTARYNGIMGVGFFPRDCGADCNSSNRSVNPGNYFGCNSSGCFNAYTGVCGGGVCAAQVAPALQVINPIAAFGANGMSMTLPAVANGGSAQITGTFTIGIPATAGVTVYGGDSTGQDIGTESDFETLFNSDANKLFGAAASSTTAYLDSGSNGLFFPVAAGFGLVTCSDNAFFCPAGATAASPLVLNATIKGFTGAPSSGVLGVSLVNADTLFQSGNTAFSTLAAKGDSTAFAWGLPFFYGRTVYVGQNGAGATFNGGPVTGPYWAF